MRNKLKVSTNTSLSPEEKRKRVLNILKEHPEGISPKIIAFYTGINENTVKSVLKNLKIIHKVLQREGLRGLYFLVEKDMHGSIFDWNFHNTTLACLFKNYSGEKINKTFNCGTINYEFDIGKESQKASVRISSDNPINISSIFACYSFFAYFVKEYTGFFPETKDVTVSSIEFNKDYSNFKLEGINCITLDRLLEQFKLYQKELAIRAEYKLKVPIPFESIMSMLINAPLPLELINDISCLKNDQEKMKDSLKRIIELLTALLEKE